MSEERKREAARRLRSPSRPSVCHGVFPTVESLNHIVGIETDDTAFVDSKLYYFAPRDGWVLVDGANATSHEP